MDEETIRYEGVRFARKITPLKKERRKNQKKRRDEREEQKQRLRETQALLEEFK